MRIVDFVPVSEQHLFSSFSSWLLNFAILNVIILTPASSSGKDLHDFIAACSVFSEQAVLRVPGLDQAIHPVPLKKSTSLNRQSRTPVLPPSLMAVEGGWRKEEDIGIGNLGERPCAGKMPGYVPRPSLVAASFTYTG